MPQSSGHAVLDAFASKLAIANELPYCSGTVPLDSSTSTFFYRSGDKASVLDFANATDSQLAALAQACQPASFGRDKEDILDESYRKAGKMETSNFSTLFSPHSSGIVGKIAASLQRTLALENIKVDLYKLNVYGPGSFFKSHIDTPRSDTMFGSLVVVFPIVHDGGSLVFRHQGQEWTFDSAQMVSSSTPQVAFAAFYSDVEHEVLPVTSGYRVTLTYNLHTLKETSIPVVPASIHSGFPDIQANLAGLLADPAFLPEGGLLGFGLSFRYPFNPNMTVLSDLAQNLKGSDALTMQICEALGLKVSLKALYRGDDDYDEAHLFCLMDRFANFKRWDTVEGHILHHLMETCKIIVGQGAEGGRKTIVVGAQIGWSLGDSPHSGEYTPIYKDMVCVAWAKPLSDINPVETSYISYGNEPVLAVTYGEVCLVAKVEPAAIRLGVN